MVFMSQDASVLALSKVHCNVRAAVTLGPLNYMYAIRTFSEVKVRPGY
jgi:hypothetical protein